MEGNAYLVIGGSLLSKRLDGWYADSQVEATNVVNLGVLDLLPDVVLLQMLDLVVVGSSEVGAHGAVVASDDNTAAAGGRLLVVEVLGLDTSICRDLLKSLTVLVLANAADVYDRLGLEDVRSTPGSVLGGTASNEDGVVVLEQVLVQSHVLLWVGEDGIVVLQAILFKKSLVTASCQRKLIAVLCHDQCHLWQHKAVKERN